MENVCQGRSVRSVSRFSKTLGFSLIEMMVSISVGTILLSVGLPGLNSFVQDNRRSAAINEFVTALNYGRVQAITERKSVSVCRSTNPGAARPTCAAGGGWQSGWVVFVDDDSDGNLDTGENILRQHAPLSAPLMVNGNSHVNRRITFKDSGVTANNGRLTFCDSRGWSDAARVVVVSVGGRVRTLTRAEDSSNNDPLERCLP